MNTMKTILSATNTSTIKICAKYVRHKMYAIKMRASKMCAIKMCASKMCASKILTPSRSKGSILSFAFWHGCK